MLGPYTLTRIVLTLLVVAFLGVIAYMIFYNLRVRARQKQLTGGDTSDTPSSINAATESLKRDAEKH